MGWRLVVKMESESFFLSNEFSASIFWMRTFDCSRPAKVPFVLETRLSLELEKVTICGEEDLSYLGLVKRMFVFLFFLRVSQSLHTDFQLGRVDGFTRSLVRKIIFFYFDV